MTAARLIAVDDATPIDSLEATPCVLVVGNFDGVHLGHQAVLRQALEQAQSSGLPASVLAWKAVRRRSPCSWRARSKVAK